MTVSLLPSSVLLVGGIIIWQIWRNKQARLQAETNVLTDELQQIKEQMADIQTEKSHATHEQAKLTVEAPPSSIQQPQNNQKSDNNLENIGLFEHLIKDNIQLRQQSS